MAFNFKKTKPAEETNFFKPGVYRMAVTKVEGGTFEKKGTPFMAVTFVTQDKQELIEKFVISDAALGRIQYLHESWFGKLCEVDFSDEDELIEYFSKKFAANKKIVKRVIVGGDEIGTAVFAHLPFTKFIDSDEKLELGEFEKDAEEWKKYVRHKEATGGTSGKANGLLNDDDGGEIGAKKKKVVKKEVEEDEEEAEKEPVKETKKPIKPAPKKVDKKKPEPVEEDEEETDEDTDGEGDDELPW